MRLNTAGRRAHPPAGPIAQHRRAGRGRTGLRGGGARGDGGGPGVPLARRSTRRRRRPPTTRRSRASSWASTTADLFQAENRVLVDEPARPPRAARAAHAPPPLLRRDDPEPDRRPARRLARCTCRGCSPSASRTCGAGVRRQRRTVSGSIGRSAEAARSPRSRRRRGSSTSTKLRLLDPLDHQLGDAVAALAPRNGSVGSVLTSSTLSSSR